MVRKQVEINGERFTLGEALAGELEDCDDTLLDGKISDQAKVEAMRRLVAHCLNRGGHSVGSDELRQRFTVTENAFLYRASREVSGMRSLPEGETLGP